MAWADALPAVLKLAFSASDRPSYTLADISTSAGPYTWPVSDRYFWICDSLAEVINDSGFSWPSMVPCCTSGAALGTATGVGRMPMARQAQRGRGLWVGGS